MKKMVERLRNNYPTFLHVGGAIVISASVAGFLFWQAIALGEANDRRIEEKCIERSRRFTEHIQHIKSKLDENRCDIKEILKILSK